MPNRIIRESALTSHSLASLSDGAERLFWRLTVSADDHGRFDAHPVTVKAKCFPTLVDTLKTSKVCAWLTELSIDHCIFYTVDGRAYGQFRKWAEYQRTYNLKSKFPEPPADCGKLPEPPALIRESISENRESRIDIRDTVNADDFARVWEVYPNHAGKEKAEQAWRKPHNKVPSLEAVLISIEQHKKTEQWQRGIIPHLATWLNQKRWRDEVQPAKPQARQEARAPTDPIPKAYRELPTQTGSFEPMPQGLLDRIGKRMPTLREA